MKPVQRLLKVVALNRALDELASARIKSQYGDEISRRELVLRLASLHLSAETMRCVFDWDPGIKGF